VDVTSDDGSGRSGDVRAELVQLLPRLRRFAFSQTRSVQEADDLVQAACERALSRLDQFQPGSRLDSWMFTIMRNLWIDDVRGRSRRPEFADTEAAEAAVDHTMMTAQTEARSDLERISSEMERLPAEQLGVLTMVVMEGKSYREVSELLDIPIGTVMSRLSRARAKLALCLGTAPGPVASKVVGHE
jgi:RNA polymerase sigma-70 factor (ECF subfamily)